MKQNKFFVIGDKEIRLKKVITPKHLSIYAKKLTKTNRDCPIAITGYAGEGKSVLSIHIAKHYDRRFDYERNMIYSRDEFKEKINTLPPSALSVDENMNVLYKRDWGNKSQKEIIKLLDICRYQRHMLMFIQPTMTALDSHVRDTRLRLWVLVLKRGLGAVFRPLRQLSYEDPWRVKENDAIIKKWVKKLGEVEGRIEGCYHCENFLSFIRWDNIEDEDYKVYEEVKDRKKDAYEETTLFTEADLKKAVRDKLFDILAVLDYNKKMKRGYYGFVGAELEMGNVAVSSHMRLARQRKGFLEHQQFNRKMTQEEMEEDIEVEGGWVT